MAENMIQKFMEAMDAKLTKISESIAKSEANLDVKISESEKKVIAHIDTKYNELSEQIVGLENRISALEKENTQQSSEILELKKQSEAKSSHILELEMKVNRCNVILFNFEENEITPEELLTNLVNFFKNVMKVIMSHTDIDVVYRLGKEQPRKIRPVFIGLTTMKMRDYVFSCRRNLKGSKVSISEDCPKEIIERRRQLLPALLGAKKSKKKAFFKFGTLFVNGVACSDEDIEVYCKVYNESSKRPRTNELSSPTITPQETKKPRNVSALRYSGRPKSLSLTNLSAASSSQQIKHYFNTAITKSPNVQTEQ